MEDKAINHLERYAVIKDSHQNSRVSILFNFYYDISFVRDTTNSDATKLRYVFLHQRYS